MHASRRVALTASALALALAPSLTACAGDDGSHGSADDKTTPVIVEITEDLGSIVPDDGGVVKVESGQTVELVVTSDVDDEIHVHSDPEHEFAIAAGDNQTFTFTIDIPGHYAVESHDLDVVIVKLQVG